MLKRKHDFTFCKMLKRNLFKIVIVKSTFNVLRCMTVKKRGKHSVSFTFFYLNNTHELYHIINTILRGRVTLLYKYVHRDLNSVRIL